MTDTTTLQAAQRRMMRYLVEEIRRAGYTTISPAAVDDELIFVVTVRSPLGRVERLSGGLGAILTMLDNTTRAERDQTDNARRIYDETGDDPASLSPRQYRAARANLERGDNA